VTAAAAPPAEPLERARPVLVTGASKGIGAAIATRLAADGYPVVVHYGRDEAAASAIVEAIVSAGGSARMLGFDVRDRAAIEISLGAEVEANGAFWGIVLNAGITRDNAFPALGGEDWDSVLRTNLDGFYNVLHPLIMPMVRRRDGGRIVAISSVAGLVGNRGQVNYSAAKAGIIGASKALAIELGKRRITVNCVAPGIIDTAMTEGLPLDEILAMIPLRRMGTTAEVAATVAFLMSPEAGYITRQVISVNGGLC
jgi:3-oxoacyl-[acyl-carrier protein] reductase